MSVGDFQGPKCSRAPRSFWPAARRSTALSGIWAITALACIFQALRTFQPNSTFPSTPALRRKNAASHGRLLRMSVCHSRSWRRAEFNLSNHSIAPDISAPDHSLCNNRRGARCLLHRPARRFTAVASIRLVLKHELNITSTIVAIGAMRCAAVARERAGDNGGFTVVVRGRVACSETARRAGGRK